MSGLLENKTAVIYGGGGAIETAGRQVDTATARAQFIPAQAVARHGAMTGAIVNLTCGSMVDQERGD